MSEQLNFDLLTKPALGRDDFFVSPANAITVALIDGWRGWLGGKLLLYGSKGVGKTHLAHVWAAQSGAEIIQAKGLSEANVPILARGSVAVENVPDIAGQAEAEAALFYLHNLVLGEGHRLLLTGRGVPATWGIALPDLASRIAGTHQALLSEPDDALFFAVLTKLFADRQISPRPDVVPYLVDHVDRSFEAAAQIIAHLDQASLAEKRNVTRIFAARMLADLEKIHWGSPLATK
ncbi:MAG: AAA family ATPase [Rhodobacteraceae bacterium]|nr:AAA family ATPase [Paracoccaceae bacterium]